MKDYVEIGLCWGSGSVCFWAPDPNPDPLVSGTDPAPDPSIIKQKSKRNLYFHCYVTSLWPFIFEG
jgi:hypothetical protein